MNYGRIVVAAVAATVVFFICGFLVQGLLITKDYAPYPGVYRPADAILLRADARSGLAVDANRRRSILGRIRRRLLRPHRARQFDPPNRAAFVERALRLDEHRGLAA